MANTYSQAYLHIVFSTKFRRNLIEKSWKDDLNAYVAGIIRNHGQRVVIVNSMPDHIHIFYVQRPHMAPAALMQNVKSRSSVWVKKNHPTVQNFQWQEGFGMFSCSPHEVEKIYNYIKNQETHHQREDSLKEFIRLLQEYKVDYQERYLTD